MLLSLGVLCVTPLPALLSVPSFFHILSNTDPLKTIHCLNRSEVTISSFHLHPLMVRYFEHLYLDALAICTSALEKIPFTHSFP